MVTASSALPRWDMEVIFPSLTSPEFEAAFADAMRLIAELGDLFDRHGVGDADRPPAPLTDETVAAVEESINRLNDLSERARTLGAYISAFVTTDSRDTVAQAKLSELEQNGIRLAQLYTRFVAWLGTLDVDAIVARSELAREHGDPLRRAKQTAAHLMSRPEEELAVELSLSGGSAWGKLHDNLTSQIMVRLEQDGQERDLPMSMVRNLAHDPDREVRRRAYEAELVAWEAAALPLAAALNGVKGQDLTLAGRRHWGTPLDEALFDSRIDRQTLDAMMSAAHDAFPDFRRYLRAKARALGSPTLPWYDLFAPVGGSNRTWEYGAAEAFIVEQFGTYSDRMRDFAARAFRERWIDAEPRAGKVGGAFCMSIRGDESRVLMNFSPNYGAVSTLGHELGHAYHNLNLGRRTMLQRDLPMTLAETASIFCETIVTQAALREADEAERLAILEESLQNACQVVVDITSRFLFEQRVFERRRERELAIEEFSDLILDAQRETYGDGLDPAVLHPYMWAVKGHYYRSGGPFYNYPYMFGLLFGLGLYAQYQADPEKFKAGYDDLLASTGMDDAAPLAARFGIDITAKEFWQSSFDIIRANIDRFEQLTG